MIWGQQPAIDGVPGQPWTDRENDIIVEDHLAMLVADLNRQPLSKAAHRRALLNLLPARGESAIEFKHQNIAAVMLGLGQPRLTGYAPAANFQLSLVDAVVRFLDHQPADMFVRAAQSVRESAAVADQKLIITPTPFQRNAPPPIAPELLDAVTRRYDAAQRDAANRALGRAGEELALSHEKLRLTESGRPDLAQRVEWTAQIHGDGAGFDVRSFTPDGRDRLIEVKTTNGWDRTPFHISANELAVADVRRDSWVLLRIYEFARSPSAFELQPPLSNHAALTPTSFLAHLH